MKKILSFLLILCFAVGVLSACGNSKEEAEDVTEIFEEKMRETELANQEQVQEPQVTPTPEPEKINIEWTDFKYTTTDADGYTYEITYKISPWILLSNTEAINSAWSEVGKNNTLPSFDDWGLQKSGESYMRIGVPLGGTKRNFTSRMTDMYYSIGTVQIRNTTNGWDITSSSPRAVYANLNTSTYLNSMAEYIGRTFYSNSTEDQAGGVQIRAQMTSNAWGPVSFVIMAPENFSPNYPDGEYKEQMLGETFYVSSNKIKVGLIDKNGVYTPPTEESK